jgi:hypothetical protein
MEGDLTVRDLQDYLRSVPGDLPVAVQTPKGHTPLAWAVMLQSWEIKVDGRFLRESVVVIAARRRERK